MRTEDGTWLAEVFEEHRAHLRAVAYRMLGSLPDADDAVQDAWVRFSQSQAGGVDSLGGYLTTIVARICLNTLRARKTRRPHPRGPTSRTPGLFHRGRAGHRNRRDHRPRPPQPARPACSWRL